jgi:HK97 family phage prohead protease
MVIKMSKEIRQAYFQSSLSTRAEPDSAKYIEGYFAVFNQETELWRGTYEKIAPGAFDNSIKNNDIRCLFNHDSGFVLGRNTSKTLELKADNYGLWGRVKINENDQQALAIYARVERGDISGCSFGFWPEKESYEEKDGEFHWTVEEANTEEVSICTFPAYPQTEIQARKKDFEESNKRKLETQKQELRKRIGDLNAKATKA